MRVRKQESQGVALSLDHRAPGCVLPEVRLAWQRPPRRAVQDVKVDQRDRARWDRDLPLRPPKELAALVQHSVALRRVLQW